MSANSNCDVQKKNQKLKTYQLAIVFKQECPKLHVYKQLCLPRLIMYLSEVKNFKNPTLFLFLF